VRSNRGGRGFTLLEAVFAGFVISISIAGLSGTMAQGHLASTNVRDELVARRAIRSKMAEIRGADYARIRYVYGAEKFAVDGLEGVPASGGGTEIPGSVLVENGPTNGMVKITIRVKWWRARAPRTIQKVYFLTRLPGS
jgi:type II secretory pathway pseudopilin PulG